MTDSPELSVLLHETSRFDPPAGLAATANAQPEIYEKAKADRLGFWAEQAEFLTWEKKWDEVLQWELPHAKWFVGGTLNASVNCVDRHVAAGNGDRVAIHWIGEPEGDTRDITYRQLKDEVCKATNALIAVGREDGRPGRHLHADDPGDGVRDAGLRAPGRPAHGRVRRILLGGVVDADHRLRCADRDHRGRRLAQGRAERAEAGGGRGAEGVPRGAQRARGAAHRPGGRLGRGSRRVVARRGGFGQPRAHPGGVRFRASAVHHVHVRDDG